VPSAHRVCVNSCRKLHPSCQARGAVTAAGGVARKRGGSRGSVDGRRSGLVNRAGLALCERKGPRCLADWLAQAGMCRRRDRERQRRARPAPALPKKQSGGHRPSRGSTRREGECDRSWCRRRPIATPPGVENAGNGISAPAARSALPARVSARVKRGAGRTAGHERASARLGIWEVGGCS
jgi:hypothetical protein